MTSPMPEPDRAAVRAAVVALTSPPKPDDVPDLGILRTLLVAFGRRPLWLDAQPDHESTGGFEIHGIVAPSTGAEIAAGADEIHEVGDLYPIEATALAVAAINALPWLLDQVADKTRPLPATEQPVGAIVATGDEVYRKARLGTRRPWESHDASASDAHVDGLLAAGAELLRGEWAR